MKYEKSERKMNIGKIKNQKEIIYRKIMAKKDTKAFG